MRLTHVTCRHCFWGLVAASLLCWASPCLAGAPVLPAVIKARTPHDPKAFTQGLLFHDGMLYESTGLYGHSSLRRVDPTTGKVLSERALSRAYFGEGLALVGDRLFQLTWKKGRVLVSNLADLSPVATLPLAGEGWGLCALDGQLVVSDGSNRLTFYDPQTWTKQGEIAVTDDGVPVTRLNELETVGETIWANVWGESRIAVIDPATGQVRAWVDCSALEPEEDDRDNVLNGLAWDAATGRIWVTGKRWPTLYQITVPGLSPTAGGQGKERVR